MTDEQLIDQLRQQARGVRCSIAMEQNVYQICERLIEANAKIAKLEKQGQPMAKISDQLPEHTPGPWHAVGRPDCVTPLTVIDEGIDAGVILLACPVK